MSYLFSGFEEKERIPHLEKEITRLQDLCRTNFGIIADLKKENQKLTEIHMELKETTSDLAYSLAEYPWWGQVDHDHTLNAFKILVTYTKNIQYILQLPIFFDPLEQLKTYGFDQDKALRFFKMEYLRKKPKGMKHLKCPKCKKQFTSNERRKKHIIIHNMKKLHCKQCGKNISSFQNFKSHLQSHEFTNQMLAMPSLVFPQSQTFQQVKKHTTTEYKLSVTPPIPKKLFQIESNDDKIEVDTTTGTYGEKNCKSSKVSDIESLQHCSVPKCTEREIEISDPNSNISMNVMRWDKGDTVTGRT